ncbi:MAG: 1,4-beta-glucanase [Acidimicrobiaceae bacterium]|nr:1,4-beta-glucanase [Acidimicrobiaceae bacterium]
MCLRKGAMALRWALTDTLIRALRMAAMLLFAGTIAGTLALHTSDPSSGLDRSQNPLTVTGIHVVGSTLVNDAGTPIRLIGLNRSGTEYACAQGWGIFDGPSGPSVISSMKSWYVNAVRIPLNEDCWLGINVPPKFSGAVYRAAIERLVQQLSTQGIVAILDLHWSAPGSAPAESQQEMPDTHSVAFWRSLAETFRTNARVVFELYNEPNAVAWQCWVSGCQMPGGWRSVGMQTLINVVRETGASQPVIVDGLQWANDLSGWLSHPLIDPKHQLVAGFHVYPQNSCVTATCWETTVATVAKTVPVIATEVGEDDCSGAFFTKFVDWANRRRISVLAWTWNDNQGCRSLIRHPDSGATTYGLAVRRDFERIAR